MNSEKVKESLFQEIFFEKNQHSEVCCRNTLPPLEMMLPPSLHSLSLGTAVPGIDKYLRAKFASAGIWTLFFT